MIFEVIARNFLHIKNKKRFIWVSVNTDPKLRNSTSESPTFWAITKVDRTGVQLKGPNLVEFSMNFIKYKFFFILSWINICAWSNRKDAIWLLIVFFEAELDCQTNSNCLITQRNVLWETLAGQIKERWYKPPIVC